MAQKFFPDDWEKMERDELVRSRSRLLGFMEATPDKDKLIRDELESLQKSLEPLQDSILKVSIHLNISFTDKRNKSLPHECEVELKNQMPQKCEDISVSLPHECEVEIQIQMPQKCEDIS